MLSPPQDECSFEALEAKVLLSASVFDVELVGEGGVEDNSLVLIQEDISEQQIGELSEEFESFVIEPGEILQGEGELDAAVVNEGVIAPGNSPGEVEFESLDNSGGELSIEIGGSGEAGVDYDLITVEEGVTLGGKLKVSVIDDYEPQIGDEFEFLTFSESVGDFLEFEGLEIGDGDKKFVPILTDTGYNLLVAGTTITMNPITGFTVTVGQIRNTATEALINEEAAVKSAINQLFTDTPVDASYSFIGTVDLNGLELEGEFTIGYSNSTLSLQAENVNATFEVSEGKGFKMSNGTLTYSHNGGDYTYSVSGNAAVVGFDAISLAGSFSVSGDHEGADSLTGTLTEFEVLDVVSFSGSLSATYDFEESQLRVSGSDVDVKVEAGSSFAGINDGELALLVDSAGKVAVSASGSASITLDGFSTISADSFSVSYNNTGEDVDIDSESGFELKVADGSSSFTAENFNGEINGFASVSGTLSFEYDALNDSLIVLGDSLTVESVSEDQDVALLDAVVAFVVNDTGIVFDARGDPRLGLPVFDTVTVDTIRFKYNDTGVDYDGTLTIGDLTHLLQVEDGVTDIILTNFNATLSGFAAFSGNLSFRYNENKKQLFGFGSNIQLNLEGIGDSVVLTEGEVSFLINSENNIVINASAKTTVDNTLLTSLNLDALATAFNGFTVEKLGFAYNNTGEDFSQEVTVGDEVYYLAGNNGDTLVYFQGFEATVATFAQISGDFYFYYDADTTEIFGFGRDADIDFVTLANGGLFNNGTISFLVDANDKLAMNVSFGVEITPETLALFNLESLSVFDSFSIGKLGFSFNDTGADVDRSFEIAGETLSLVAEHNVNALFANNFEATINDFVSLSGNLYFEYNATEDELTAVGYDISAGYYDDLNTIALTNGNLVLFINELNKFAIEIRGSPNLTLSGFASFTADEVFIRYNNTGSDYTVNITVDGSTVTRTILDGAVELGITSGTLDFNGVSIQGSFVVTVLADDQGLELSLTNITITIDGVLGATVASGQISILNIFDFDGAFVRTNVIADIEGLSVTSALSGVTFTGTYNLYLRFTDSLTHIGLETTESIDVELLNFSFNGELNFIYSKDNTSGEFVLLLDVDNGTYSLADGVLVGSELSGSFVIIDGEIGGVFTTQVAVTLPGVSVTTDEFTFIYSNFANGLEATFEFTEFTLELNFDSGLYIFIEALGVDLSLAGMNASGNAAFRLVRNSDEWNVYLLFNNLTIGDGDNSLKNGSGVFHVISTGVAGEIYGEVALNAGVADANGAFKLRVNTTEAAVDENFSLAGIDYVLKFNGTNQAAANYFSFSLIDAVFRIGDNIQVSGETVVFEEDEDGNKTFSATGLSVFVGDGIAFLEDGQINDSAFGFLMTNVAVIIYQNADGEILFQAVNDETGTVSLVGSDEVKFSGRFTIRYNETTDLKSVTVPVSDTENVTLTFEDDEVATDSGAFLHIEAVDVAVEVVNVVTFTGGLQVTFDRVAKQVRLVGNEMSARVSVGANFIGFDEGEVDLLITEEGKIAIKASGSGVAELAGFSSSSIELFSVSYNNTGSDVNIFDGDFSLEVDNNVFELVAQGFVSEINGFSRVSGSLNLRYDADANSIVLLGENMSVELLSDNAEIGIFNGQVAFIISEAGLVFDARGDPRFEISAFDTPSVETIRFRYNDTGADVDETLVIGDLEFHLQVDTGVTDIVLIGFDASLAGFGSISGNLFLSYNENTGQLAAIGTDLSIRLGGINGGALITEGVVTFLLNADNTIAINARGKVVVNNQFLEALNLSALATAFNGFSVEQVGLSFNNTGEDVAQQVTITEASEFLLAENNKTLLLFEGFEATIAGFVSFTGDFYFVYDEDEKQVRAFGRDAEVSFVNLGEGSTLNNGELVLLVNEDGTLAINVSATLTVTEETLEDLGLGSLSALGEFSIGKLGYSYNNTGADIFTSFEIAGETFFLSAEDGVTQLFARDFAGSIAGFIEFSGNLFFEYREAQDELFIVGYDVNAGYFDQDNTIALRNGNLVLLIDSSDKVALEIRGSPDVRLQGFASFTAEEVIIRYNDTGRAYTVEIVVEDSTVTRTIGIGAREFTINSGVLDFNGVTISGSFTISILPDSEGLDLTLSNVTALIDGVLTGTIAEGVIEIRTQKDSDGKVVSSNVNADIEGISITSLISDVSFTGVYNLYIRTSADSSFIGFETVENIEATIFGLKLIAGFNFIYDQDAQGEYVLLLNVLGGSLSLADGLFSASEIQGSFVIVNGEMGGTFSTQLEINIPGISFEVREFALTISNFENGFEGTFEFTNFTLDLTFESGLYVNIEALGLDVTLAGLLNASANASFTLLRDEDSKWKIYLAFSDASVGDGDNSLTNGRGVFYIDASGIAGEIVGEVGLSAGAFEAQGSMKFRLNTTKKAINETVSLGGKDYTLKFTSTAEIAANYYSFSILNASFQLGEYLKIEGSFDFTTDDEGNEVFHGSDLRIFLGDGIAYIEDDVLREGAFGIALLDATVTLVRFEDGTLLFKATGSAKVIGSAGITLSGDITAVYNSSNETSYSFVDGGGETRSITLGSEDKATDGVAYIDFGGSNLELQVGDVYLSGSFAFEIDSLTGTIITIGATDVDVFLGTGGATSDTDDDKGLALENASGLFVFSKNGIAGFVKGGVSVVGFTDFSFSGEFEFQINTFRDDSGNNIAYSASIEIANGSTVSFNLPESPYVFIQGTNVSLTVGDSTLSGDFAIEYTTSEENGFQFRAALANINVAFGEVVQVTNALGIVQITADGLVAGLRGGLAATLDAVSVTGEFTLLVNATSENIDSEGISFGVGENIITITDLNANSIVIRGDNVNLTIGDVRLSGNLTFSYDGTNKVTLIAVSSASITLFNNGAEIIKGGIDEALILITPEGFVLQAKITIDAGDVSVDQLEFSGTFDLTFQNLTAAVDQDYLVGEEPKNITLDAGVGFSFSATTLIITIGDQELTGDIAFAYTVTSGVSTVTVSFSNVTAKIGYGSDSNFVGVTITNGAGVIEVNGLGVVGYITATPDLSLPADITISASSVKILFNTTSLARKVYDETDTLVATIAANFIGIQLTNLTFSISTLSLTGNLEIVRSTNAGTDGILGTSDDEVILAILITDLGIAASGDDPGLSGGKGFLIITDAGVAGYFIGKAAATVGQFTADAEIGFAINTTGAAVDTKVQLISGEEHLILGAEKFLFIVKDAALDFGGLIYIEGNLATSGDLTVASGVTLFIGAGPYMKDGDVNPDAIGVELRNVRLALYYESSDKFALVATGELSLIGLDGLTVKGTVSVRINTLGKAVDKVGAIPGVADSTVELKFTSAEQVFEVVATDAEISIAGYLALTAKQLSITRLPNGDLIFGAEDAAIQILDNNDILVGIQGDATFNLSKTRGFELISIGFDGITIAGQEFNLPSLRHSSTPAFKPAAYLIGDFASGSTTLSDWQTDGYVDIYFGDLNRKGLNESTITDTGQEFAFYDATGNIISGITIDGSATAVANKINIYRYNLTFDADFVSSAATQTITVRFIADSFADNSGIKNEFSTEVFDVLVSATDALTPIVELKNDGDLSVDVINAKRFIDVTISSRTDEAIDLDALFAKNAKDIFSLSGSGAANADISSIFRRSDSTVRIFFTAKDAALNPFAQGEIILTAKAGQISLVDPSSTVVNRETTMSLKVVAATQGDAGKSFTIGSVISVENLSFFIDGMSFSGGTLTVDVGITAGKGELKFGTQTATLEGLFVTFAVEIDALKLLQFDPSALTPSRKFFIGVSEFEFKLNGIIEADAKGVYLSWDENGGADQEILRIQEASVLFPKFNLKGVIKENGSNPGLLVTGKGITFGTAEIRYTQSVSLGVVSFDDLRVGITGFGFTFDGQINFTGDLYFATGGASIKLGNALTAKVYDSTADTDDEAMRVGVSFTEGEFDGFIFKADSFEVAIANSLLTLKAEGFELNLDAGDDERLVYFTKLSAQLKAGPLDVQGEARNFGVTGDGSFIASEGFAVILGGDGVDSNILGLPAILPVNVTKLGIIWQDINNDIGNFNILISASVNTKIGSMSLSGFIRDLVISPTALVNGEFPIVSLGSVGVSAGGTVGGAKVSGTLVLGLLQTDAAGNEIDPLNPNANAVAKSTIYLGIAGTMVFPGGYGFGLQLGISDVGILSLGLSVDAVIPLDAGFLGGTINLTGGSFSVDFGIEIDDINSDTKADGTEWNTTDIYERLRQLDFTVGEQDASEWDARLRAQTLELLRTAGSGSVLERIAAQLTGKITLSGSVRMTIGPAGQGLNFRGTVAMDTTGKFYLQGDLFPPGEFVTMAARMYFDLSPFVDALRAVAEGQAPPTDFNFSIVSIITIPDEVTFIEIRAGLTFEGDFAEGTFGFTLSGSYRVYAPFVDVALVVLEGKATLEFDIPNTKMELRFTTNAYVIGLEDIGRASGAFIAQVNDGNVEIFGAILIETGIDAFKDYGLEIEGDGYFAFNLSNRDQLIKIDLLGFNTETGEFDKVTTVEQTVEALSATVFVAGSVFIKDVITDSSNPTTLLSIEGLVYVNIARDGLKFLAVGQLDAEGFVNLSAAAAFILRTDYEDGDEGRNGIAGMVTLDLSAGADTGLPIIDGLFEAELTSTIAFNTTLDNQVISVPAFLTDRTSITIPTKVVIYASKGAPTLGSEVDESQSGRGPPNGEVYFFAKIFVRISILNDAILLVGELQLTAGESGTIVQGQVTGSVKYIGAVTGSIYLETTGTSAIGRIVLDVDANLGILDFDGNFLLEINTTSSDKTVQTYKIEETRTNDVLGFNYVKNSEGELEIGSQTIAAGVRLVFAGNMNVELGSIAAAQIQAYTVFEFGPTQVSLVVDGKLKVGSLFTFQIIDSGFIISNEGVVTNLGLRFESSLAALGMGVFGEVRFQLNTTSGTKTIGTTMIEVGALIDIQGSISFVGLVSIKKAQATIEFRPGKFSLSFSGELGISLLALNVSGSLDITTSGIKGSFAVNLQLGLPVIGVSGNLTATLDTANSSFNIKGQASINMFSLLSFRTNIEIGVGKGSYSGYGFNNEYIKGEWYFTFSSRTSFFGVSASISGFLDSRLNFDFALNLGIGFDAGIIDVSGSIAFKMRGEWDEDFTGYTASASFSGSIGGTLDLGIASVGASAGISATATATFSAARIKAGGALTLGLSMSVSGSLSGSACVGAWKFRVCVSKSFGFNTSLDFGSMTFTGLTIPSIEPLATEGASESEAILKVGDRKIDRTVEEQNANEVYTIVKIGETYVINAFGEEQEFDDLTKIIGYFTDGDDGLILGQGVSVELDITFTSGTNFVTIRDGNTISGRIVGGSDKDTYTFDKGQYDLDLDGGEGENNIVYNYSNSKDTVSLTEVNNVYVLKTDNDKGIRFTNIQQGELNLNGGDDEVTVNLDKVANLSLTINLDAGSDTLSSLNNYNGTITGGANGDVIHLATSSHAINVDTGSGIDKLFVNHRSKNATTTLAQGDDTKFTIAVTQNALISVDKLEELTLNLAATNNDVFVNSLDNTNLEKIDVKLTAGGVDSLVVRGKVDTDDTVTLTDDADSTDINVSDRYTISIFDAARANGDTLRIDLENKNNILDAYQLTHDRLALTVVSGDGHDYIKASQFDDIIEAGAGNNWVVGNLGEDTITTLGGNDTILGDEGAITGDILTNRVSIQSSNLEVGSNDIISSTGGNNTIIGGAGSDTITTTGGDDYIFGDNAEFTYYTDGVLKKATTLASSNGGVDSINAGSGANTVIGGVGSDTITTTEGDDYIFGDDAEFTYYTDRVLTKAATLASLNGGVDQINAGSGTNTVIGGVGSDTITTTEGDDYIFGDDAELTYYTDGVLSVAKTLASENGDDDSIDAGLGSNFIVGGVGIDTVTTTDGDDYIFGDDAEFTYYADGVLKKATTLASDNGGNDQINAGSGTNTVIGGVGSDTITTTDGDDHIFGDDAEFSYDVNGLLSVARSLASENGAADVIDAGNRHNTIIGGVGADRITSTNGNDYIFGDDAEITYEEFSSLAIVSVAKSLASENGGNDIIDAGNGNNFIIGGVGADTIDASQGDDYVFGDDAELSYSKALLTRARTLASDNGGDDVINLLSGNHFVVGGVGADSITVLGGIDYVFGDDADLEYDIIENNSYLRSAMSLASLNGGNDTLLLGAGDNQAVGGVGQDLIVSFAGDDFVFGDDAHLRYNQGVFVEVKSLASSNGDDDTIRVGSGTHFIVGGAGADEIEASEGDDYIFGDDAAFEYTDGVLSKATSLASTTGGNDIIEAGSGNNTVIGGAGRDSVEAFEGVDYVFGDDAVFDYIEGRLSKVSAIASDTGDNDYIDAGAGDNVLIGGSGSDTILSFAGADINVGDDAEFIYNEGSLVTLRSLTNENGGADQIDSSEGNNIVIGGFGNDQLTAFSGNDLIFGDEAEITFENATVTSALSMNTTNGGFDLIEAGSGNNVLIGGESTDLILSFEGDDLIFGDSTSISYANNRVVSARSVANPLGDADEVEAGSGNNTVIGGEGSDRLVSGENIDYILGDNGSVEFGESGIESLISINTANPGNDTILSGKGDDVAIGGEGQDIIATADGDDLIIGDHGTLTYVDGFLSRASSRLSSGNDNIIAGSGDNIIIAGGGDDRVSALDGNDTIFGDDADLRFEGTSLVSAKSLISFFGGDDTINAGSGSNTIVGGERSDTLQGFEGDDLIFGDSANIGYLKSSVYTAESFLNPFGSVDSIEAGAGTNVIIGGEGADTLESEDSRDLIFNDDAIVTYEMFLYSTETEYLSSDNYLTFDDYSSVTDGYFLISHELEDIGYDFNNVFVFDSWPLIYTAGVILHDIVGAGSNADGELKSLLSFLTNSEDDLEDEVLWVITQMMESGKITNALFDLINNCEVHSLPTQMFLAVGGNAVAAIK